MSPSLRGQSVSVPHRSAGAAGANHRQPAARPAGPATRRPGLLVISSVFKNSQRCRRCRKSSRKQNSLTLRTGNRGGPLERECPKRAGLFPDTDGKEADIKRSAHMEEYFSGRLAPYSDVCDDGAGHGGDGPAGWVQIISVDNAILSGFPWPRPSARLLRPGNQERSGHSQRCGPGWKHSGKPKAGYEHLFDTNTGHVFFGWDAHARSVFGWEDGAGNFTVGT